MPFAPTTWKNLPALHLVRDAALAAEWDRLNAAGCDLPFLSAAAMVAALEAFGTGTERLLVGEAGGQVAVMALAAPSGRFRWQTFQPSQIPLGAWVAEPGIDLRELGAAICSRAFGFCLAFSFTQVDPRFAPRGDDSATTRSADYIETGWIELGGSFEDFWNARGKNLRQNMRKQRNKLEADGVRGHMVRLAEPGDMAAVIERYGALESAGWKAASGTAIHPGNAQGRFYTRLLMDAAKNGEAIAYEYRFDDRPVAIDFCVGRDETITILKTTYDESVHPFSPAFLLLQDMLEEMHGEGRWRRVEFYGRMMEWHTRWTETKRTLYHLTCYRWPVIKWAIGKLRNQSVAETGSEA